MLEPEEIVSYVISSSKSNGLLKGKKVLISSGPTEEPIDPVRVITNRSSGKMGVALAREALIMGADVTVVSGPSNEPFPSSVHLKKVTSASQMQVAMQDYFTSADICIMAAAVSDYRVAHYSETKIQRNESGTQIIELVPNPDILANLGKVKGQRVLVGFSLESGDDESRAIEKMEKKGCDLIVFNRADMSLGLDSTKITILGKNGFRRAVETSDKSHAAQCLLECVASRTGK
jgi:phosphopantothenoylcysteine decarboxylase/phosphopantothenate--cysteine ligase